MIKIGEIQNELDFERALIADRKLRVLSKENIFTPTNSATKALEIKNPPKIKNSRLILLFNSWAIIASILI